MSNSYQLFGLKLKEQIENAVSKRIISKWAYDFYLENCKNIKKEFEFDIMKIVAMEEGPEFDLDITELSTIAEKYVKM
jgi:undecaprenyl pyrophosphate synthase